MAKIKQMPAHKKFKSAMSKAPASAKFAMAGLGILVFILIYTALGFLFGSDQPASTTQPKSRIEATRTTTESNRAIITDSQSDLGALVFAAEQARIENAKNLGQTAVGAVILDRNEEDISPFNQPTQGSSQFRNVTAPPAAPANTVAPAPPANTVAPAPPANTVGLASEIEQQLSDNPESNNYDPKKQSPGTANIYEIDQLANDPLAGLSRDRYTSEMGQRRQDIQGQVQASIAAMIGERQKISGGITPIAAKQPQQNRTAGSTQLGQQATNQAPQDRNIPPMLMQPGDYIIIVSDFPVDSRTTTEFVAKVRGGLLDDARVRCLVRDIGDFLVPECVEMTFKGSKNPIAAMVINPNTMSGRITQDVDNDTMMKNIALIGSRMLTAWGTNKIMQGQQSSENSQTGSVTTRNTLSNRDILLASTATSLGDMESTAAQYYAKPSVKTIMAGTPIMLVMTQPIPDWWGLTKENTR